MFVLSQSAFCGGKIDQRQACDMRDIEHVRMLLKMLEASRINLSLNLNRMEAPPVDMTYVFSFHRPVLLATRTTTVFLICSYA